MRAGTQPQQDRPDNSLLDIRTDTRYGILAIRTFRHRGLKRFLEGDPSKVRAEQARWIADVLGHLDRAVRPSDLDLPGYRLHSLKGIWRILFRFIDGDAFDVDLQDYH